MEEEFSFVHKALSLVEDKPLVYTAMSKHYFYFRMHISCYVLEKDKVLLNPFMLFDYFLLDKVDRDLVGNVNNSVMLRSDQIWVFGSISNGVSAEILLAKKANKPVRYFKSEKPLEVDKVEMEEEVDQF
jgi:hypothetical protein